MRRCFGSLSKEIQQRHKRGIKMAAVVIDMQSGFSTTSSTAEVVANQRKVLDTIREINQTGQGNAILIYQILYHGKKEDIFPELAGATDKILYKGTPNAFDPFTTNFDRPWTSGLSLHHDIRASGIETLIIMGQFGNACVQASLIGSMKLEDYLDRNSSAHQAGTLDIRDLIGTCFGALHYYKYTILTSSKVIHMSLGHEVLSRPEVYCYPEV